VTVWAIVSAIRPWHAADKMLPAISHSGVHRRLIVPHISLVCLGAPHQAAERPV
jgi:hypothetical protein